MPCGFSNVAKANAINYKFDTISLLTIRLPLYLTENIQSSFRHALHFKLIILTIFFVLLKSLNEGKPIDPQLFPTALAMILL